MVDFHIPHAEDAEEAEEVYEGTAKFVEQQRAAVKREPRISRIKYYVPIKTRHTMCPSVTPYLR